MTGTGMESKEYQIQVEDTGEQFVCKENEVIFEAMKRAGCGPIRYGCFGGGCGICRMKIVSGSYAVVKKMSRTHVTEGEAKNGIVLICCVKPRANLVIARIKAIKKG